TAKGKGLTKASRTAKARSTITLTLKAKGKKKLRSKVRLSFTPAGRGGQRLAGVASVRVR
ncbi:MAG TPA: hypothetical protein VHW67_09715, partial [Solirubrobacteraceae bacterium]|nr:hypothetical protein [Solirubrobacteraceae bacterium]